MFGVIFLLENKSRNNKMTPRWYSMPHQNVVVYFRKSPVPEAEMAPPHHNNPPHNNPPPCLTVGNSFLYLAPSPPVEHTPSLVAKLLPNCPQTWTHVVYFLWYMVYKWYIKVTLSTQLVYINIFSLYCNYTKSELIGILIVY